MPATTCNARHCHRHAAAPAAGSGKYRERMR